MEKPVQPQVASKQPPSPFACRYSPNLPELLMQLNCTLALSTYQAGKVVFISAKNENELVMLPRTFNKAMGMTLHGDKLGIATKDEIIVLANSPGLAVSYPNQPNTYDGLFVPRATYYTGQVDIHDLDWGEAGLWAVNTSFSALCLVDDNYSFIPKWQPPFITALASEDRCHLNGLTLRKGKPEFVTALGTGDTPQSWRDNITKGGTLMHVDSGQPVLSGLPMPHSPRFYQDALYMLFSATGDVVRVDTQNGRYDVINNLSGFVRGLAIHKDHMFVGLSRLRKNSSTFKHLEIADKANHAGIKVIHLPTGALVGELIYQSSVDEIYDVQILPEMRRPGILNTIKDVHRRALAIPGSTFWAKEIQENDQQNRQ